MTSPTATVVVTIDTECDAWAPTRVPAPTSNLRRAPAFQARLESLGLRPTWLATWRVATDEALGASLLRELHANERAEVGAHLHPWTTPPAEESAAPTNTMLCNLPAALQRRKLAELTERIAELRGGSAPVCFRAGRFGFGPDTAAALIDAGYAVDSSVTPCLSWREFHGPTFEDAPRHLYRLGTTGQSVSHADPAGALVEVPVTVGFTRRPERLWRQVHRVIGRAPLRRLHLRGLAHRTRLLRRAMLSPETADADDMLAVARHAIAAGQRVLTVMLHSQSLAPGLSPFCPDEAAVDRLGARLADFVTRLAGEADVVGATLAEAAARHAPPIRHRA